MKPSPAPLNWRAEWIWTTGETQTPFHVAYFRHRLTVKASRQVVVHVAADSCYQLWVDGVYTGSGPARGHAEHPYYDSYRLPMTAGDHVLAFQVQHYTAKTVIFAPVRGGLICQVEANGDLLSVSDERWRALDSDAYAGLEGMLMPQNFDARREPEGWYLPDFDDTHWPLAAGVLAGELAPPEALLPRPIPMLTDTRLVPRQVIDCGLCVDEEEPNVLSQTDIATSLWRSKLVAPPAGEVAPELKRHGAWPTDNLNFLIGRGEAVFFSVDFGQETLAVPAVRFEGDGGIVVDLGYSESLWQNRVATRWQHQRQAERLTLREGVTEHRLLQPRGFRYLMMRLANPTDEILEVTLTDLAAYERIYPTSPKGGFTCSDPLLDDIYQLAARTVNLCMEDAYTDCPWRERSQWVGDAQPETLFSYYCFGAYDLARKAVLEFTGGNTPEGWIPGVFPTGRPSNLPTWGMRVPVIAWEYYLYTGDDSVLANAFDGVREQMNWFARYERHDGLLVDMPGWCFVDWTTTDDRYADGAVQGWYLEALEFSARLADQIDASDYANVYRSRATRLRETLARLYWSEPQGAFRKYRPDNDKRPAFAPPEILGQQENFLFSLLGVGAAEQRRRALDAMAGKTGRYLPNLGNYQSAFVDGQQGNATGETVMKLGSPFWSYYALLALLADGRIKAALDYQRLGWGLMLEHGATSCWEMWDRNTSLCHGWSGAPAMILPAYVLGIQPLQPGFRCFSVAPRFGDLEWAKGVVPTPHGPIACAWRKTDDGYEVDIDVPAGTAALATADVPGQVGWLVQAAGDPQASLTFGPGHHQFAMRRPATT